jgi:hypothetical protein
MGDVPVLGKLPVEKVGIYGLSTSNTVVTNSDSLTTMNVDINHKLVPDASLRVLASP